eukprot:CAMPEP_0184649060 /NCGR_PEP_ID=MMETSP0308-20130426/6326_1 /TAXON_ID=38269 /ORGANISM="Gloeochaete witrockiana, Strain SAG 46.84" /LENGTH=146 /DNA_ID=CAMNT_0027081457 /DNA_START=343 /DNA_END=783 /DNA_ORIENTATION=-
MAEKITPFNDDPSLGHLSTPISNGWFVQNILGSLPAYRKGLTARFRGLEIGMAHGYFLPGPFVALGPLRNTDSGILAGSLSAAILVLILSLTLSVYGKVTFSKKTPKNADTAFWESGEGWDDFVLGWAVGGVGSVAFAYLLLQFFI